MAVEARRVQAIFLAAVRATDHAEEAALLDQQCGADEELRRRVEALLQAHRNAASILDQPAVPPCTVALPSQELIGQPEARDGSVTDALELSFLSPATQSGALGRIGHYEVFEVLGRGGFGIVLRARDETLQRLVAVKVLAPNLAATSPARKRFLREARAYAAIRHENVVQVYAVEEQPLPYLVMEYLPGETLQQMLDRIGPLEVPTILRIGRQIAAGLAAAHDIGLIHRDVKPANVLIEGGKDLRVKLTDFGLARAADDASITQSGLLAGSPLYMAPEQARGKALDHRADLFSLGSVLYVMCTGRPPFRATSALAILERVCEDTPRPIHEIMPETPSWLCDVIKKLQAKNPAERFQSAREVADLLQRYEDELRTHGKVVSTPVQPRGSWTVPLAAAIGGVVVVLVLLLGRWFPLGKGPPSLPQATSVQARSVVPDNVSDRPRLARPNQTSWFAQDPAGKWLALGCDNNAVLLDPRTLAVGKVLGPAAGPIYQLAFSPDGQHLATASRDTNRLGAVVWSVETGKPTLPLSQAGDCLAIQFSPDGTRLLTVGQDHQPTLWDVKSGVVRHRFPAQDEPVCYDVTFSPDGKYIITHARHGDVQVWDARTWEPVKTLPGPEQVTEDLTVWRHLPLAVSRDGKLLAAGSEAGFKIWKTNGWQEQATQDTPATWLAFTPDGRTLLTGPHDCTAGRWHSISRWDTKTGERRLEAPLGSRGGWAVYHLSVDGKTLYGMITDPAEPTIHVYDAETLREHILPGLADRLFRTP